MKTPVHIQHQFYIFLFYDAFLNTQLVYQIIFIAACFSLRFRDYLTNFIKTKDKISLIQEWSICWSPRILIGQNFKPNSPNYTNTMNFFKGKNKHIITSEKYFVRDSRYCLTFLAPLSGSFIIIMRVIKFPVNMSNLYGQSS